MGTYWKHVKFEEVNCGKFRAGYAYFKWGCLVSSEMPVGCEKLTILSNHKSEPWEILNIKLLNFLVKNSPNGLTIF